MLPPTLSCEVRSIFTPRSANRRASVRCTIVAPTWDLMSSPTIGSPRLFEALVPVVLARDEHRDAVDEAAAGLEHLLDVPLGRLLGADGQVGDDDVGVRVLEDLTMSAVSPGALVIFSLRYLPRPSWVIPRCTGTPSLRGTLANLIVLFWPAQIASPRSLPTFVGVDVEGGGELDVADVVAAEVDVHQAGHALRRVGVAVVVHALHERRARSCRRR